MCCGLEGIVAERSSLGARAALLRLQVYTKVDGDRSLCSCRRRRNRRFDEAEEGERTMDK